MLDTEPEYSYSDIKELVSADLKHLENIIYNKLKTEIPLIEDLSKHILSSGGKRIRPILTIISSYMCGYNLDKHFLLAASVEFIHTATLLHDDVIDESKLRRGKTTANALFGDKASILVGDFLFTKAFELMLDSQSIEVLNLLAKASSIIAQGEILQLATLNDCNTSEEKYLQVIFSKTASLFSAATEIGPILSGEDDRKRIALKEYGKNLGLAFQIIDDALDYVGKETIGKSLGDDFKEGKVTLPIINCIKKSTTEEKIFWRRTLEKMNQKDNDFDTALKIIKKYNTIELTKIKANEYAQKALKELEIFPNSKWKSALQSLTMIAINRND